MAGIIFTNLFLIFKRLTPSASIIRIALDSFLVNIKKGVKREILRSKSLSVSNNFSDILCKKWEGILGWLPMGPHIKIKLLFQNLNREKKLGR